MEGGSGIPKTRTKSAAIKAPALIVDHRRGRGFERVAPALAPRMLGAWQVARAGSGSGCSCRGSRARGGALEYRWRPERRSQRRRPHRQHRGAAARLVGPQPLPARLALCDGRRIDPSIAGAGILCPGVWPPVLSRNPDDPDRDPLVGSALIRSDHCPASGSTSPLSGLSGAGRQCQTKIAHIGGEIRRTEQKAQGVLVAPPLNFCAR